jgi:serine/threonine-protein kinase
MRALAKDPDDRYQSAEEMDADLQRIARGAAVSRRTEEAATAIIAAPTAMPTTITRAPASVREPPPPSARPVYYDYDEPLPARRPVWPWLLALVLVAAAAVAGFLVYQQIQDQLAATKPIAVPGVVGARRVVATERLSQAGFDPRVRYDHSDEVAVGYVISQDPEGGDRAEKGSIVHVTVSLGKELVAVPALKGQQLTQAIAKVASLGLTPRTFPVPSDEPQGTVTGQNPPPGKKVAKDTAVRINYSKGPERIQVPSLLGQQYDAAAAALQTIGLVPARRFTDSNQPAGTVLDQDPAGGEFLPKGSTVTLFVSKGPPSVTVPSVLKLDEQAAKQRLQAYGLRADVIEQDVTDDLLNGFVLTQDPVAGRQVTPNSVVTITVGRFKPEKAPVP